MQTLNQIVKQLRDFSTAHAQLKTFSQANISEITTNKSTVYPLMFVELDKSIAKEKTLELNFNILMADQEAHDKSNRLEIQSDMLSICNDLYSYLLTNTISSTDEDYMIKEPISLTPFSLKFNNQISGYMMKIGIEVDRSVCDIPLNLVQNTVDCTGNEPVVTVLSITHLTTTGTTEGAFTLSATTNGEGATYSMSGGSTNSTGIFDTLSAGTYTVTVTNSDGCSTITTVQIYNPFNLVWDDINSTLSYVADYNNVDDWNTWGGWSFTHIQINGNTVQLFGDDSIVIADNQFLNNINIYEVVDYANICTAINTSAFQDASYLNNINLPACLTVDVTGLYRCLSLSNINLPTCTLAEAGAFAYSSSITDLTLPSCLRIGNQCFDNCTGLVNLYLPSCLYFNSVGSLPGNNNAIFYSCSSLQTLYAPSLLEFGTTTGNDNCYNVVGLSTVITVPTALSTCDGGNPDGDLVGWLTISPLSTIIYV